MADESGWTLQVYSDMCKKMRLERIDREKAVYDKLGKPHSRAIDTESGVQRGFWRIKGGIVSYEFHPREPRIIEHSRMEYPDELLDRLAAVRQFEPV